MGVERMNKAEAFLMNHEKTKLNDFRTPEYLMKWIDSRFGPVDYDAACEPGVNNLFSPLRLEQVWPIGSTVYSNPPYDAPSIIKWFNKGLKHVEKGGTHIMLIPNKLCQKSFIESIHPFIQTIVFIGGRVNFEGPNITKGGSSRSGSIILINEPSGIREWAYINLCELKKEVLK